MTVRLLSWLNSYSSFHGSMFVEISLRIYMCCSLQSTMANGTGPWAPDIFWNSKNFTSMFQITFQAHTTHKRIIWSWFSKKNQNQNNQIWDQQQFSICTTGLFLKCILARLKGVEAQLGNWLFRLPSHNLQCHPSILCNSLTQGWIVGSAAG